MRLLFTFILGFCIHVCIAQHCIGTDTLSLKGEKVIQNIPLFSDSLVSSFCIYIKKEVKLHKHQTHSEHVYVIRGKAEMQINDSTFIIKKGDLIFIPKGSWHAVKVLSRDALKVISIQAPLFDGSDRIIKNE